MKRYWLLGLLAVAGCEKSSNVTAMQEEANGFNAMYKGKFDDLQKRVALIEARGRSMQGGGQSAGMLEIRKLYIDTNKRLSELKQAVQQATASVAAAGKSENARAELVRLNSELREKYLRAETEITSNLDTVETWMAYIEYRPRAEPAVAPTPTPDPIPEQQPGADNNNGKGPPMDHVDEPKKATNDGDKKPPPTDKKPDAKPGQPDNDKKPADKKPDAKPADKPADKKPADKPADKKPAAGSAAKPANP